MPSDTPPPRPTPGAARPQAGGGQGPASPEESGVAANAPTIINPALRRFWRRADDTQETPQKPRNRVLIQSFYWAFVIIVLVVGAGILDSNVRLVEKPKPEPVKPNAVASLPDDSPLPVFLPRPEVVSAYGTGGVVRAEQQARRLGAISEQAVTCGRQAPAWVGQVRNALADDITERMPAFDEDSKNQVWMQEFVRGQFNIGQVMGTRAITARGRDAVCADVQVSLDYAAAARLVRAADAQRQAQAIDQGQLTQVEQLPDPTRPRIRD